MWGVLRIVALQKVVGGKCVGIFRQVDQDVLSPMFPELSRRVRTPLRVLIRVNMVNPRFGWPPPKWWFFFLAISENDHPKQELQTHINGARGYFQIKHVTTIGELA